MLFWSQAFTVSNQKINNKKRNLHFCRFLNFSGQYNTGDYFDKNRIQRVLYGILLRWNNLRTRRSCDTRIHTLVYGPDRRTCVSSDSSCKYQNEKQQSYTQMSRRMRNNNISRIHGRMHCEPRFSYERLGLFRTEVQPFRSDMSFIFNDVVFDMYPGGIPLLYSQKEFMTTTC